MNYYFSDLNDLAIFAVHVSGRTGCLIQTRIRAFPLSEFSSAAGSRRAKLLYAMLEHFEVLRTSNRQTFLKSLETEVRSEQCGIDLLVGCFVLGCQQRLTRPTVEM